MDTKRKPWPGLFKGIGFGLVCFFITVLFSSVIPMLMLIGLCILVASPVMGYKLNREGSCPHCQNLIEKVVYDNEAFNCKKCQKRVIFKDEKFEAL